MTKSCSIIFSLLFFLTLDALAQDTSSIYLDEVSISGRAPSRYQEAARSVTIITKEQIQQMPVRSINELLDNFAGVDIRQRGPAGVQADVSIRGESFENVLILVNGIRMNDPQTGHHNLNLPVPIEDIKRVEILRGPAARIHGQNAFSGVINFITRKPDEMNVSASATAGQFGYYNGLVSGSVPVKKYKQRISLSRVASDGFRPYTDFDNNTVFYQSALNLGKLTLNGNFGFNDKAFGANGFYAANFPTAWEATQMLFGHIGGEISGKWRIKPNIYWRRHTDEFLLKREDPAFYRNLHTTHVFGADINASRKSKYGITSIGAEARREQINSTNLGEHARDNLGLFLEHRFTLNRFIFTPGLFASWYSGYGAQAYPGIDAAFFITPNLNLYATAGRSYRVPTYTELYYTDPANRGNANLQPEEAYAYEAGIKYGKKAVNLAGAVFYKDGRQIIDWTRNDVDSPWTVQNISMVKTGGAEASIIVKPAVFVKENFFLQNVSLQYTYLNSVRDNNAPLSKYVFDYLRHQFIAGVAMRYAKGLYHTVYERYENRVGAGYTPYWITDTRLSYRLRQFELHVNVTNLFDQAYFEVGTIPQPGRWISGGLSWRLK